ncbi:MAG: UDP-N-acetylglucosamine diphosphorylase [bacterium]
MIFAKQLFRELPEGWIFGEYLSLELPIFEWVRNISVTLNDFFNKTSKNARIFSEIPAQLYLKGDVYIGENVSLPPYGYIEGPAYIGDNCVLRPSVYIRGNVIAWSDCVLGNSCEFKNALLLDHVQVPHFNYVGDSILGSHAHLGAGCILSNLRFDRQPVRMRDVDGQRFETGLKKLGGLLGDYAEAGCNAVLQPGACLFPKAKVFPCEAFGGTRV